MKLEIDRIWVWLGETGRQLIGNLAPGTLYQYPNLAGNLMGGM